jgi:hypothetical protein
MSTEQAAPIAAAPANSFFTELANTRPYIKAGFMGLAGSGKSTTGILTAIAIHQAIKSNKPIVFFDTERAVKFLQPYADAFGIRVLVKESRSLADWVETVKLCAAGAADVLVIDSVTHLWDGLLKAHQEKVKRAKLQIDDWGVVKPQWKKWFSDPYLDSRLHIVMCGRAGDVWANEMDEDTGRRKSYNTGVHKMKVEGETGFEPHLLVDMDLIREDRNGVGETSWREALIVKDRSNAIDGKKFRFANTPDPRAAFAAVELAFRPAIERALAGAVAAPETDDASVAPLLATSDDGERAKLDRRILLEEVDAKLLQAAPGQGAKEKQWRIDTTERLFGSPAWAKVEVLPLEVLRRGRDQLNDILAELRGKKKAAETEGLKFDPNDPTPPAAPAAKPAKAKDVPAEPSAATDGAEVEVVKPMDMLTRERLRRAIRNGMHERNESPSQFLSDETGREVRETSDLTDDELTRIAERLTRPVTT